MRLRFFAVILLLMPAFTWAADKQIVPNDLRVLRTRHYRIHTDLDRALAEDLARRMDAMHEEYARRLSTIDTDPGGDMFDVYLFAHRKNYLDFTGNRMSNAGGVTMPDINVVAAYLDDQGRDSLRQTLQHEAFHQFAASVIHPNLAPWINEGMAVMFQEGIWTGRSFLLGQVAPRRVRQLQRDIGSKRFIDFKQMMPMKLAEWNATLNRDRGAAATEYTQAWAMCQFLVYATENGRPKYRARFLDMLRRIHGGTESLEAFKQAYSANIDGFETRFLQWARNLEASPEAAIIERQNVLADMLSKFSQQGKRFETLDAFRQTLVKGGYQMQYSMNDIMWVTDADARIYFRTLDGRAYNSDELYFDTRSGAPLDDLVCAPAGQLHLRTRFYDLPARQIEHETLVEGGGGR